MPYRMPDDLLRLVLRARSAANDAEVIAERASLIATEAQLRRIDRRPLEVDAETDRRLREGLTG